MYNALKINDDLIPHDKLIYMKKIYMDIVKENMLMTSELISILKLLKENNINATPFKGPVLSELAYGDVISRQYVDIDILINNVEDLEKVDVLLKNKNYFPQNNIFDNKLKIEILKDVAYFNTKTNLNLEIHWKLFSFGLNNSPITNNKTINFRNIEINSFDMNFYIVYLAIHGSRHLWERIEWIVDINKLIYKNQDLIDLNRIYEIAELSDNRKSIELSFYLCNSLFGNEYLKKKYENSIISLSKQVLKNLQNKKIAKNTEIFLFHNKLYTKNISKIKHFLNIFKINDRDLSYVNYKNRFRYYLIKPVRLLSEILK